VIAGARRAGQLAASLKLSKGVVRGTKFAWAYRESYKGLQGAQGAMPILGQVGVNAAFGSGGTLAGYATTCAILDQDMTASGAAAAIVSGGIWGGCGTLGNSSETLGATAGDFISVGAATAIGGYVSIFAGLAAQVSIDTYFGNLKDTELDDFAPSAAWIFGVVVITGLNHAASTQLSFNHVVVGGR
jgi:hypothetical protein